MKMHSQRTLQLIPNLWTVLTLEIVCASLLYIGLISIFGIAKNISFFITLGIAFLFVILGFQFIPKHLLLLEDKKESSPSKLSTLIQQSGILQKDQKLLPNAIASFTSKDKKTIGVMQEKPIDIFLAYAHQDKDLLDRLEIHLSPLRRKVLLDIWSDVSINPGMNWKEEIDKHLESSQIILLLVSPDFLASDTFYNVEIKPALERYKRGEAKVIPIILRPVSWKETPFRNLQPLPANGEPVISSSGRSVDDALSNVAKGVQKAVEEILDQNMGGQWQRKSENIS